MRAQALTLVWVTVLPQGGREVEVWGLPLAGELTEVSIFNVTILIQRYKRQSNNAGQYHYHGNINCTDAGAATGANNPDTCKLIGEHTTLT